MGKGRLFIQGNIGILFAYRGSMLWFCTECGMWGVVQYSYFQDDKYVKQITEHKCEK